MIISKKLIQEVINEAAKTGCDFAELFIEDTYSKITRSLSGKIESMNDTHVRGAGLRLALGANYVYGYTNSLDKKSLLKLASDLRSSFNEKRKEVTPLKTLKKGTHHKALVLPQDVDNEERVDAITRCYNQAKNYSDEIVQVSIVLSEKVQNVLIANMDGRFVSDQRVNTRLMINSVAKRGSKMESGSSGHGMCKGFELIREDDIESFARNASRIAITNLDAIDCPSGEMPVIIENGFGGVIFHEAVGHSLEATSVAMGASVFSGLKGQKVANKCVTAIDDGTLENEWGSENFDDEGNKQRKRVLIKNGILNEYMIDELNGKRMNEPSSGSSRRESYKYAPTSRMSNTFIAPGKSSLEDMLKDIKLGLYCANMGGGSVNPATGDFNFATSEAYLIEDGKITKPVKGASLVGTGREIIANIDMVGDNLKLGQGVCGSASGSVPTNVGQPRIRVKKITVGGRA